MFDMMCCKPVFYLSFGFPDANPANSTDEFIHCMHFPRQRSMLIVTEEKLKTVQGRVSVGRSESRASNYCLL